jgi:hypothetical protein
VALLQDALIDLSCVDLKFKMHIACFGASMQGAWQFSGFSGCCRLLQQHSCTAVAAAHAP